MPRARSAYWSEFQRAAIEAGLAREVPEYEVVEALRPIQIPVRWRQKRQVKKGGEVAGTVWRDYEGVSEYAPGQVLRPEWRLAAEWEADQWQNLSDGQLRALGAFSQDGAFSIQIVEKIKDLPAAIRQRGRHIPRGEIVREGRRFTLPGDAHMLAAYASRLSSLMQGFLEDPRPSAELREQVSFELAQISQEFVGKRATLKRRARQEIEAASQGQFFWEVPVHAGRAVATLLEQRARDYETAVRSLDLAMKWRSFMADIERRFRSCYRRLGQLGQELRGMMGAGQTVPRLDLLRIADEAHGIFLHLQQHVPNFNPYYERLQEPEWQRLSRVRQHAEAGRAATVYNFIAAAVAKLEAVAIGEQPTRAELARERETLF